MTWRHGRRRSSRAVPDEFYELPVTLANNIDDVRDRFTSRGLEHAYRSPTA
ncbi:hypothetical protein [Kibdelosporangium aridum]|uniref:hypothetical protein n=1 Tax=Kibdelosporangium aridum TaxID=2030 RepID=UPI000AC105F7|nr:hypothetical protein [Kibdelosporangium aridum]